MNPTGCTHPLEISIWGVLSCRLRDPLTWKEEQEVIAIIYWSCNCTQTNENLNDIHFGQRDNQTFWQFQSLETVIVEEWNRKLYESQVINNFLNLFVPE